MSRHSKDLQSGEQAPAGRFYERPRRCHSLNQFGSYLHILLTKKSYLLTDSLGSAAKEQQGNFSQPAHVYSAKSRSAATSPPSTTDSPASRHLEIIADEGRVVLARFADGASLHRARKALAAVSMFAPVAGSKKYTLFKSTSKRRRSPSLGKSSGLTRVTA
jgi:hypothetical protein